MTFVNEISRRRKQILIRKEKRRNLRNVVVVQKNEKTNLLYVGLLFISLQTSASGCMDLGRSLNVNSSRSSDSVFGLDIYVCFCLHVHIPSAASSITCSLIESRIDPSQPARRSIFFLNYTELWHKAGGRKRKGLVFIHYPSPS